MQKIAKEPRILCASLKLWISAAHFQEIQNTEANRFSGEFNESLQWKPEPKLFEKTFRESGMLAIDLFASRTTH